jgi:hypothetical protein
VLAVSGRTSDGHRYTFTCVVRTAAWFGLIDAGTEFGSLRSYILYRLSCSMYGRMETLHVS